MHLIKVKQFFLAYTKKGIRFVSRPPPFERYDKIIITINIIIIIVI
jgi:hypothetical protein